MGFYQRHSLERLLGLTAVALASIALGCRSLETPADLATTLTSKDPTLVHSHVETPRRPALPEPTPPSEFQDDSWILVAAMPGETDTPTFRWQHAGLAKLLALPPEDRPDVAQLLTADDSVTATNAAILLRAPEMRRSIGVLSKRCTTTN